jgi:hypothetical protein
MRSVSIAVSATSGVFLPQEYSLHPVRQDCRKHEALSCLDVNAGHAVAQQVKDKRTMHGDKEEWWASEHGLKEAALQDVL